MASESNGHPLDPQYMLCEVNANLLSSQVYYVAAVASTGPKLVSISPSGHDQISAENTTILITFHVPVVLGAGIIEIQEQPVGTPIHLEASTSEHVSLTGDDYVVQILLNGVLKPSTEYEMSFNPDTVTDVYGHPFFGFGAHIFLTSVAR